MDLINNLIFTSRNETVDLASGFVFDPLTPDFVDFPPVLSPSPFLPVNRGTYFSYNIDAVQEFCALDDSDFIERAIQKHWADMVNGRFYTDPNPPTNPPVNPDLNVYFSRFRAVPAAGQALQSEYLYLLII